MKPEQSKPAGARAAPDVGNAQVLHRDPDHAAVARGRGRREHLGGRACDEQGVTRLHGLVLGLQRRSRKPGTRLSGEPRLPKALGGLEAGDLVLDRGEQAVAFGELALDRLPLGRAIGDDLHLLRLRPLEPHPSLPDLCTEALHLAQDARVLRGDPLHGVEPVHQVVDRPGSEQHVDRRALAAAHVQRDESLGQVGLGVLQALARDHQVVSVRRQLSLDPVELQAREVVRLDRLLELAVDLLDLREHVLRLGAFRLDRVGRGCFYACQGDGHQNRRENSKERRRLPPARANCATSSARTRQTPRWGPGPSQVGHPSRPFGQSQRPTEPKTRVLDMCLRITNNDGARPNLLPSPTSWGRIQRGARRASWPS